ncbi:CBS domain-containing protein [Nocardioidaceae bacterium]|nr:CBS domain-containing protein [Nocardioidaceae bacterium]
MRISQILSGKPEPRIATIAPDATLREVLAGLAEANVGALVVTEDGHRVVGIVSERDVVRRLHLDDVGLDAGVREVMTADVQTTEPGADVDAVMSRMTSGRFRHLPVCEDGRLVGVVSIGDLVKARIDQLEFERDQLGSYVQG